MYIRDMAVHMRSSECNCVQAVLLGMLLPLKVFYGDYLQTGVRIEIVYVSTRALHHRIDDEERWLSNGLCALCLQSRFIL